MTPGDEDLWFLPLGGCGEIGINMNLYGHAGRWLMVDCGIGFDRNKQPPAVIAAEPEFIASRRDSLVGLVITHVHEDHIGGVAYLWPELQCPIYCTPFAATILRRKLREEGLVDRVPVHVIAPGQSFAVAGFSLRWIAITHSTPESQALEIETSAGRVFHTGDWKLDNRPLVGPAYRPSDLQAIGQRGVRAMVCDSTCATVPGRTPSEGSLHPGLAQVIGGSRGRVIVACFGSNIARLRTLAEIAAETGRYAALLGRSLENNVRAARVNGYWPEELELVNPYHLGYLPPEEVLAIATGSQGEARAALSRLARGDHPALDLVADDTVVFSARRIPGNEEAVGLLRDRFEARGIEVIEAEDTPLTLHASGHPARDDLADMYRWIQPALAVPVHGEPHHLEAHADLAKDCGARALRGSNGDLFMLAPVSGIRRAAAVTGRRILRRG
ncbi:MAG: ribonuclease J [Pseudomonadota bacterium]